MSTKVLIIGRNSFLAKELIKKLEKDTFSAITHNEALAIDTFDGVDCIVNFAYNPILNEKQYEESFDICYLIRKKIIGLNIHYVMISSRKVYGDSKWNSKEVDELRPGNYYGVNKKETERRLLKIGVNNLTILRVGNVMGEELEAKRIRMGSYMIKSLKTSGDIEISYSLKTRKDVISSDYFVKVLGWVVSNKPDGIYNIGSGCSQEVGEIGGWLINGYGKGKIIGLSSKIQDEFQLDCAKFKKISGLSESPVELKNYITNIGKTLREK
jgi:nucleoside-diphosphate-sugar epimerase